MDFMGSGGNPQYFNRYAYTFNDPVNHLDPDGNIVETVWDAGNVVVGVASLGNNLSKGNYGAAGLDALGVVVDGAATVVPFVPGGAAAGLKAARAGKNVTSRIGESKKAIKAAEQAGKNQKVQKDIDGLTSKLKDGNMNPGTGTKSVGDGVSEARGRNGGRVLFRETGADGVEILGKSGKNSKNQQDAISAAKEIIKKDPQ